jgi:hypothetical protein
MSRARVLIPVVFATAAAIALVVLLPPRRPRPAASRADDLEQRLQKLRSLPYTAVTADMADSTLAGVLTYMPDQAYRGYNLYCSRTTGRAILMDMTGKTTHTWSTPDSDRAHWVHAVMMANGDLLVVNNSRALIKLAWDSSPIWKARLPIHHEITVMPDSTIYVLGSHQTTYRGLRVRFDTIVRLAPDGRRMRTWWSYDHLQALKRVLDTRSFLDTILDSLPMAEDGYAAEVIPGQSHVVRPKEGKAFYEYFHMNTITIIPDTPVGRQDSRFAAGNLLVCFRNVNQIAVLEKDTKKPLWAWGEPELEWPHYPTMLENGNILIFDNGVRRGYSRVVELNPITEEIEWEYVGDPPEGFYSYGRGSAQRLPNRNTLICESDRGRAFEVTPGGKIVWEWLNPEIAAGHREQIYRMIRLEPQVVESLLGQ